MGVSYYIPDTVDIGGRGGEMRVLEWELTCVNEGFGLFNPFLRLHLKFLLGFGFLVDTLE